MTRLCALYGVTRAGYYAWRRRPVSAHAEQDRALRQQIEAIFTAHCGRSEVPGSIGPSPRRAGGSADAGWSA